MLLGVIADVHSNLHALVRGLDILEKGGVDEIFFAGDAIGYGAYPNECCEMIRKACGRSVRGNHDHAIVRGSTDGMNPYAVAAINWTSDILEDGSRKFLESLPESTHVTIDDRKVAICHGSPRSINEYVHEEGVRSDLLGISEADLLILGHTHMPFVKKFAKGMVINPGSVGQPRDRDPRGSAAIIDIDEMDCRIVRFEYPIGEAADAIVESGLPHMLAERLKIGW